VVGTPAVSLLIAFLLGSAAGGIGVACAFMLLGSLRGRDE